MNLSHLTDATLLSETLILAHKERSILLKVLWHLKEIDRRKLYCELKCGSLYEYAVKVLKYSEGQASRRVSACRFLRDLPEISDDIQKGALNLTQLNQAKHFFHEQGISDSSEKKKIVDLIKGKTIKETEGILWDLRHEDTPRKITISLNEETIKTLNKLKALKAQSCPDLDALIMKMAHEVSKLWDPTVVHRSRKIGEGETRYVQARVKAEVWTRDQGKCRNCGTDYALEIDHIRPYGVGGKTTTDNLRLLCRNCNQRQKITFYGRSAAR
jgi:5-methylcytosine-specific restriction endonuclease McrA